MDRETSSLLERFRESQPGICTFVRDCSLTEPKKVVEFIQSLDVKMRLAAFDEVAIMILSELLDEIRISKEMQSRHLEAAFWDLVADRVKDERSMRSKTDNDFRGY